MIAIIDYGMGNLNSVAKACQLLGAKFRVTSSPRQIRSASGVIFPGVGAFGAAMKELGRRKMVDPIQASIAAGKPFLGLCLGLQLLFTRSEESPGVKGLGIFPGVVRKFSRKKNLKIPHMGWNQIETVKRQGSCPLLKGVPDQAFMYFVHSFYADPRERQLVAAWTRYGQAFPSVVWNGEKVWATQFHPEKSQKWGLKILKNYVELNRC